MTANKHTPGRQANSRGDVLASIDHEISVMAGRMATAALRKRWPDAAARHAALLRKRQQHLAALSRVRGAE